METASVQAMCNNLRTVTNNKDVGNLAVPCPVIGVLFQLKKARQKRLLGHYHEESLPQRFVKEKEQLKL
jgi:hypothetical protein